ncbi:aldehyde dehydrogenase [Polymorphobacter glacialis]|uniref:Aldehyde dehydrogenase n=1 Tax=Sandarakinorhabdus glacialis TaxID=1614636 RepID=A0A916ZUA4_9SPHN|nr:molybdopterin cofactor-binding domain-containing protein [Polymorphobacter glacialis]GGE13576.1 aldehyde dehydrogenase [Polymorphobacter glacialis]
MAVTRRSLLIATGAGAAVAIGWAVWPRQRTGNWSAGDGEHLVNAWVKIGADGRVIVAVPQAEMGQGIWSGLAQIVADELGADWEAVGVEPAPLGPDYANRGMLNDQLASMPAAIRGIADWAGARLVEYFDLQITGGSTSVRAFETPLRHAGASARAMLVAAAARRWQVAPEDCDTAAGFVIHKANRLSFADVAGDVSADDAPDPPVLRSKPVLIGKPVLRLDIPSKTDGSARFGADVRLPGMMYAAIRQDPIGAVRTAVDAKALPRTARLVEGPGFIAVVADGWYAAKTALDTVNTSHRAAATPAGPWLEAGLKAALDSPGDPLRSDGDLSAASAADAITADYTLPFLAHACLEPMTATASLNGGKCEIWAPTQSASLAQWATARALGIPDADVTVYPTFLGGGFGRKAETDAVVQAALIARAAGRPVQLIWSREEDFGHDMWRPAAAARMRGASTPAGIVAWNAIIAVPDVAVSFLGRNLPAMASEPSSSAAAIDGAAELPYAIDNFRITHTLAACPVPLGFWRSVGHSFTGFITESFIDELAHAAGESIDPGAFRLAMLKDKPRHAAVLRAVLKAGGPLGQVSPGVGRGVAMVESFGSIVAQVAEVELVKGAPPRVTQVWAAIDCGRTINPDSVRAQVESGIIYGLTAALHGRVTFAGGVAQQANFDTHPLVSLADSPLIEVIIIASNEPPGGVGEPGTPPIAPAVANAIFAAGGGRRRNLPLVSA